MARRPARLAFGDGRVMMLLLPAFALIIFILGRPVKPTAAVEMK
jgi:hypothetical protein